MYIQVFKPVFAIVLFYFLPVAGLNAQVSGSVSEIITSYGNFWYTKVSAQSTVKPDTSHTLLAFKWNNVMYSTGVGNAVLTANGISFTPGDYRSLGTITGLKDYAGINDGNTKIALGALIDGVSNGASVPPPDRKTLSEYITDGRQGLDMGTVISNIPSGTFSFTLPGIKQEAIGDGVPDFLITQMAQPTGTDIYRLRDLNGNLLGTAINLTVSSISVVGNWTGDYYQANANPMTLIGAGFTHTDREVRLYALDFSAFGITPADYNKIARLEVFVNGNSDWAFLGFNQNAAVATALPVSLGSFTAASAGNDVKLSWETFSESNSAYFSIETSTDGQNFYSLNTVPAAGSSVSKLNYTYLHHNPGTATRFYRLRQVDLDGKYQYSEIVRWIPGTETFNLRVYPNPASSFVLVEHPGATRQDRIGLYAVSGATLISVTPATGSTQTRLNTENLPKGNYFILFTGEKGVKTGQRITIQ